MDILLAFCKIEDAERQLHEELDSILANSNNDGPRTRRIVSADDIPKLQYTEKVFRESMRLYPPVWTIGRYVENDYSVGRYHMSFWFFDTDEPVRYAS